MILHAMRLMSDADYRETEGLHNNYVVYSKDMVSGERCVSDCVSRAEAEEMLRLLPNFTPNWADNATAMAGCRRFYALRLKVGDWYRETYPTDELGQNINNIMFYDLFDAIASGRDVYESLGAGDSLVRERCFEKLAKLMDTDYANIYELWLHPMTEGR